MAHAESDAELLRADEAARTAAKRVFDRPLVLEAGAGTGKTATLVARIVCWSLETGWNDAASSLGEEALGEPERERIAARVLTRVVAITFTEAAAAEMASRVGQALAALERGELPLAVEAEDFDVSLDATERAARARALRANLERLQVSTIHAFCRSLLTDHPLEAGVAPGFDIDADESRMEGAVRDTLELMLRAAWRDEGGEDIIELATAGHGPKQLEDAALELLRKGARASDFEDDPIGPEVLNDRVDRLRAAVEAMVDAKVELVRKARGSLSLIGADAVLATRDALTEASANTLESFEAFRAELSEAWKEDKARKRLKEWSKGKLTKGEAELAGEGFVDAASEVHNLVTTLVATDATLLRTGRLLMQRLLEGVERSLRQGGVATFSDLLHGARVLLERHPSVAERARSAIGLLLVDEFQDTDDEQCAILQQLALVGDTRPSLFLVGDPKQSIYGWRSADLAAYEGFVDAAMELGGERHSLVRNFRSRPAILHEVRAAIEPVMEPVSGIQPSFEPLVPHRAPAENQATPIEYWVSWPRDEATGQVGPPTGPRTGPSYEVEARAIARDAAQRAAEGVPWKEIALLFRSTGNVEVYLQALREEGVPYAVQRDRGYYRRREIVDAAALIRCVLDPNDQVALVTFLRSPAVGVPDAALPLLWKEDLPNRAERIGRASDEELDELRVALESVAARLPLEVPGLAELAGWEQNLLRTLVSLGELRRAYESESVDRFVELIRARILPEAAEATRYLGAYRLANLQRFFRQFVRTLEDQRGDTQAVLRMLRSHVGGMRDAEEARPPDAAEDAVQVLTFHGAKGLEFAHVYLVHMHRGARHDESADPNDFERLEGRAEYRLFGAPTPGFHAALERRREVENAERVRLLYVAATRASERLVVLGQWPSKRVRKNWRACNRLIDLLEHRDGVNEALATLVQRAQEDDASEHVDELGAAWRLPALDESVAGQAEREAGRFQLAAKTLERQAQSLATARTSANARMARPFGAAASDDVEHTHREARASRDDAVPSPAVGRDVARAAGTVAHRALERFDLTAEPAAAWTEQLDALGRYAAALVGTASGDEVASHARTVLERFRDSALFERFVELREHVVARELPVLSTPENEGDGPVGFVSGAIDLVFRDPATAELVVVDFKSDRADDADALGELASTYRAQGAAYVRAVETALDLQTTPRFELWFLQAGKAVPVAL